MAYRDDLAALEARKAAAEAELVEKTRARDELVRLVDEARYLARADAAFVGTKHESKRGARRRRLGWLAVAASLVAAVGGLAAYRLSPRAIPGPGEEAFAQMAAYERAMCACAELEAPRSFECGRQVADNMTKGRIELAPEIPGLQELDDKQRKCATAIRESMAIRITRAMAQPAAPISTTDPGPEPRD
jgi:hypothetical protein